MTYFELKIEATIVISLGFLSSSSFSSLNHSLSLDIFVLCGPIYISSCRQADEQRERRDPAQSETSASLHGGLPQVGSDQP